MIGQKSGIGWALDPDRDGEVLWQYRAGVGGLLGGMEWGSATDGERAYFPVSDLFTPAPGGLHAVSLATGARAWHAPPPAPICAAGPGLQRRPAGRGGGHSGRGVLGLVRRRHPGLLHHGRQRDLDLRHEPRLRDRQRGRGAGGLDQRRRPDRGRRLLLVPSGYGGFGGRPGNVLLAFGID